MTQRALDPGSAATERLREVALAALTGLLVIVFLLLLAADQGRGLAGAF